MDTVQLSLIGLSRDLNSMTIFEIRNYINNLKSPFGFTFCEFLEYSTSGNIIIKLSYPRYFAGINAYLITSRDECFEVQSYFSQQLLVHELLADLKINLSRIDIPFTYNIPLGYTFESCKNAFQIMDIVFRAKNPNSKPKFMGTIENWEIESLTYSDTPSIGGYNTKILIYNQGANILAKTSDPIKFAEYQRTYPDLPQRMRIEVSKRIRVKRAIALEDFGSHDILGCYFKKFKATLLKNFFDKKVLDNLSKSQIDLLSTKLTLDQKNKNFTYSNFILENHDRILDSKFLRDALDSCIYNIHTKGNAVTRINHFLKEYEFRTGIRIIEVHKIMESIEDCIRNYQLKTDPNGRNSLALPIDYYNDYEIGSEPDYSEEAPYCSCPQCTNYNPIFPSDYCYYQCPNYSLENQQDNSYYEDEQHFEASMRWFE